MIHKGCGGEYGLLDTPPEYRAKCRAERLKVIKCHKCKNICYIHESSEMFYKKFEDIQINTKKR